MDMDEDLVKTAKNFFKKSAGFIAAIIALNIAIVLGVVLIVIWAIKHL